MKITKELLAQHNACSEQLRKFIELFPNGVRVTKALCIKHANDFDFGWLAQNLLTKNQLKEYNCAIVSAKAEYDRARVLAKAEYDRAIVSAVAEYDRAIDSAEAEYNRATAPAKAEYGRAKAIAFYEASQI